jgi:hypothetical protein
LNSGRVFPLSQLSGLTFFYVFDTLESYRWAHVLMTSMSVLLFGFTLSAYGVRTPWTICLLAVSFFQIRHYHDPITSYAPLLQLVACLGFGSLIAARNGRERTSVLLLLGALLTYEAALAFVPPLLFMRPWSSRSQFLRQNRTLLLVLSGYVLLALGIRLSATPEAAYAGTQLMGTPPVKGLTAFLYQATGAFPLTYVIFGKSAMYGQRVCSRLRSCRSGLWRWFLLSPLP